ncbi:MAG TPA: hypothetical protein VN902_15410 [Candidatus Acidoferrales bacterium]|jgi:hypothetical protein|nr:hypothetical protein [Candidatus Acidoferrales bacterium]
MSLFRFSVLAVWLASSAAFPLAAQDEAKKPSAAAPAEAQATTPAPAAKPADVASPDAIMAATYDVISGPAAQQRDWDRFRSLFVPGARLIPVVPRKTGGGWDTRIITPDEYAQHADAYFQKNGFAEREISRKSERYGNIMQIFSTYESRHDAKDAQPFARGINSFQLFYDGTRWWVVTIYWLEETPENPLPKEFLPPTK